MRSRPSPNTRAARTAAIALAIAVAPALACSSKGSQSPNAKSPETQSDAEYDLARDLFQKGKPREALDHARKAVALNEDNDKGHYMVAVVLISFCQTSRGLEAPDCKLSDVETAARAALRANPDFRDATNLLGTVLINEKKYKEAITVLEPLTKDAAYVNPYFAWGNLGWAQLEDGQVDASITSLRNAIGTEPRFCVGHYRLGLALEKKGDLPGAEQSLSSAVTADPACAELQDAWEARGRVRLKQNNVPDARQDYARCVEISKETATGQRCVREVAKLSGAAGASHTAVNNQSARKT